jgi:hypothetical protein
VHALEALELTTLAAVALVCWVALLVWLLR